MRITTLISIMIYLAVFTALSQPRLELEPDRIRFEDIFNRLENVYFINEGDQVLKIDSITYNSDYYFVRFNQYWNYPFLILPGDSVLMDCILAGYFTYTASDTTDTLLVYSNSDHGVEDIRVKIEYFEENDDVGTISGNITDENGLPVSEAELYFFYENNYIIDTSSTDLYGNYSVILPEGEYTVAAVKEDLTYITFFGQSFDPFSAEVIYLEEDATFIADIQLTFMQNTGISVSGRIIDSLSIFPLKKGIVVVRNGTHTPTKINRDDLPDGIYTAILDLNGNYAVKNIIQPDYYFIQSFSDYFIPTYYDSLTNSSVYWQDADSVFIESTILGLDISMPRDSSLGGGQAFGNVIISPEDGGGVGDVIVYAQSLTTNQYIFSHALTKNQGTFAVPFLPYGDYRLIAQRIGFEDSYSSNFSITPDNPVISGLNIIFDPLGVDDKNNFPDNIYLYQNYPNPFNPSTNIRFSIPGTLFTKLSVYNVLGEKVAVLYEGYLNQGEHSFNFNAETLSSGTYLVQLTAGTHTFMNKILLLK